MSDVEFYSHITSAVALSVALPAHALKEAPLHVSVLAPHRLPRSRGVRGHQMLPRQTGVCEHAATGFRVADPATTWAMLASILKHPYDLVAAADSLVRDWRALPLASIADLRAATQKGRRAGIRALRDALPLVRTRSASRPETWMRLTLVDAGLPEPELNWAVREGGAYLGSVDGAFPKLKIALEYEGEHHLRSPAQWTEDIARYDRLRAAGWIVIQITKEDLFTRPATLLARVRAAIVSRA